MFLKDINIKLQPSSANNPRSNNLSESSVRNAKIILHKSIEEKSSYAEMLCHFNQVPREDGDLTYPASTTQWTWIKEKLQENSRTWW